ncbi:MAG: GNAT family N-acetyltransferase [Candidatus Rhabdochlamydia sp.]
MQSYINKKNVIFSNSSSKDLQVEIETDRLLIHSYREDHFQKYVQLYGDEKITKYFDHGMPKTEPEVQKLVDEKGFAFFKNGDPFGFFSIFTKNNMNFIGQIDLLPAEEFEACEIGYILHEQYHNQGFCTEAVRCIIFEYINEINGIKNRKISSIKKIMATVHPENYSSKKILEKIGLKLDKIQERFGKPRLWYSLVLPSKTTLTQ